MDLADTRRWRSSTGIKYLFWPFGHSTQASNKKSSRVCGSSAWRVGASVTNIPSPPLILYGNWLSTLDSCWDLSWLETSWRGEAWLREEREPKLRRDDGDTFVFSTSERGALIFWSVCMIDTVGISRFLAADPEEIMIFGGSIFKLPLSIDGTGTVPNVTPLDTWLSVMLRSFCGSS